MSQNRVRPKPRSQLRGSAVTCLGWWYILPHRVGVDAILVPKASSLLVSHKELADREVNIVVYSTSVTFQG